MSFDYSATINAADSRSIYSQLLDIISSQIDDGLLCPGDLLPSENDFCDAYHISRTTVRQALHELEIRGMIERKRGRGTFVSTPKVSRNIGNLYSFSEEMRRLGKEPSSSIVSFRLIAKDKCIPAARELASERLIDVVRIRLADGCPMLVENTYLPVDLCPNLSWEMLETQSLYAIFSKIYGLTIAQAVESYEAVIMTREESQLLECESTGPAFLIKRRTWDDKGRMIEFTKSITPSSRSMFQISMYSDSVQVERKTF